MSNLSDVSIVITYFNKINFLTKLKRFIENSLKYQSQVILINDCSTDGSSELLSKLSISGDYYYIELDKNYGSAYARNKALEFIHKPYFIFLDADDEIDLSSLDKAMIEVKSSKSLLNKFPYNRRDDTFSEMEIPLDDGTFEIPINYDERSKILKGLGYWRYIYSSFDVIKMSLFYPTFTQVGGNFFILDDFFWLHCLISNKKISVSTHSTPKFYSYSSTDKFDYKKYSSQIRLLPLVLPLCFRYGDTFDLDQDWFYDNLFEYYKFNIKLLNIFQLSGFFLDLFKLLRYTQNHRLFIIRVMCIFTPKLWFRALFISPKGS